MVEEKKTIYTPIDANKNVIIDMNSKLHTWETLKISPDLCINLTNMGYHKPSIIQAITQINLQLSPRENFLFQALNGSGKTLAFGLPALMAVVRENKAT